MRTSAAPLELPIYQSMQGCSDKSGYVDGGLVANNPAMIALASIVGTWRWNNTASRAIPGEVALADPFALGRNGPQSGGYGPIPRSRIHQRICTLGISAVVVGSDQPAGADRCISSGRKRSCDLGVRYFLGERHFHRLDVPLKQMCVPNDPETEARVKSAGEWLDTTAWFTEGARGLAAL